MTALIIGLIAGRYKILLNGNIYNCIARGIFRKYSQSPIVGDRVVVEKIDKQDEYIIKEILKRKNELIRPRLANIDNLVIVSSYKSPNIDTILIDTLIVNAIHKNINPIILFNKNDLADKDTIQLYNNIYSHYKIFSINSLDNSFVENIRSKLPDGITIFAGASGVGKTSIINLLTGSNMTIGKISQKLKRGRHTTRSCSLITLDNNIILADTPGFQNIVIETDIEKERIRDYFYEFELNNKCRFRDCLHQNEIGCSVKDDLSKGLISKSRYESYIYMLNKVRERKDY